MPNIFFKIDCNFTYSTDEDHDEFVQSFNDLNDKELDIGIISDGSNIGLRPDEASIVSGEFDVSLNGEVIEVRCNAIFKLAVKAHYFDAFLSSDKWYTHGVSGIWGDITGLETEAYTFKRRGELVDGVRYLIPVKCAKTAKELD